MVQQKDSRPKELKPYLFHGVDLDWRDGGKEASGECPFCGREKFSVDVTTGKWRCLVCDESGNSSSFLRKLWKESHHTKFYRVSLSEGRQIRSNTLDSWGVVLSLIDKTWMVPGYNPKGTLQQLYRYVDTGDGYYKLLATPGHSHRLFGVPLYDKSKNVVYLCEGPWDGMALWETWGGLKEVGNSYTITSNVKSSLLADASVLAVPGCNAFDRKWCSLFSGKRVVLMFDNDHPREHPKTGRPVKPAALGGMERIAGLLASYRKPPQEILYHCWGESGVDLSLPHGYDVRDHLTKGDVEYTD